ncbi:MAG: hypothetical protein A2Z17_04150 [Gammaproteobacteria bacterium RBG_16_66_13]|nr:MAG: hypothetical protein A2Z17_04150 [Gammaproteobacteria bacterium RBG_16_66_13]
MRIGMMADLYKPHVSGVTHYVSLNKKVLEGRGHEVFVFTLGRLDYEDDEPNVLRSPGVSVGATGYSLGFRYTRVARRRLQTMDVVHVHHPFLSGRLALAYCRPLGIPIVFTHHTRYDLYAQVYFPILPDQLGQAFLQSYMPAFCREVDLVIAPAPGLAAILRAMGVEGAIDVIPNGVDLRPFRSGPPPIQRSALGLKDDDVVLIFVGRLGLEKNLAFLFRPSPACSMHTRGSSCCCWARDPNEITWKTWPDSAAWGTALCLPGWCPTRTSRAIWPPPMSSSPPPAPRFIHFR